MGKVRAQKQKPKLGGDSGEDKKWPASWDLNLHIPGEVVEPGNGLFSFVELKRLDVDSGMTFPSLQIKTGSTQLLTFATH